LVGGRREWHALFSTTDRAPINERACLFASVGGVSATLIANKQPWRHMLSFLRVGTDYLASRRSTLWRLLPTCLTARFTALAPGRLSDQATARGASFHCSYLVCAGPLRQCDG
jgi:hypothetical protein